MSQPTSDSFEFDSTQSDWYRLRVFNYYRGFLALLFLVTHVSGWISYLAQPESQQPSLFYSASIIYVFAFVCFVLLIHQQTLTVKHQTILQTLIDVAIITVLMHASGGIRSGLGMLLIINISMASIFLSRQLTLVLAAITTFFILGEHTYSTLLFNHNTPYTQPGMLGLLVFSFAILTSNIAKQLHETELLASQQSVELETAMQLNEHIISSMRTGIIVVTPDGHVQMANNAAGALLGNIHISANVPLKKIAPSIYQRFHEWHDNMEDSQNDSVQQRHGLPDLQPGFSPIEPHLGREGRTLIFLEDASQLNIRFQQVKLASLGRLTASIAHEIRNPLGAINHAAQLLHETAIDPTESKMTTIINTQVQRLNAIVENVLQISRQQRGTPEKIILRNWLLDFIDEYNSSGRLNANQIDIQIAPENTEILFDPEHLHQVMWNLCTNAINHSGINKDALRINLLGGQNQDEVQPFLDIIDNGLGVSEEAETHLFEPFFTTRTDGTGLGLYISKEVIESNRAKIRHIAPPTGGTCFRIYFIQPLKKPN